LDEDATHQQHLLHAVTNIWASRGHRLAVAHGVYLYTLAPYPPPPDPERDSPPLPRTRPPLFAGGLDPEGAGGARSLADGLPYAAAGGGSGMGEGGGGGHALGEGGGGGGARALSDLFLWSGNGASTTQAGRLLRPHALVA
jgi:hypothetical protein